MKVQNSTYHHINNHTEKIKKDIDKIANPKTAEIVNQFINDVLQNDINTNSQEINNYNNAIGFTQIANGALTSIKENLHTIKTLKTASNNATLNSDNINAINSQIQKLSQNINKTIENTTYNGKNVFGKFQFNDITINTSMPKFDINKIDTFEKSLNNAISNIGAAQKTLSDKIENLSQNIVSKSEVKSQNETDIAKKTMELQNEEIKLNATILAKAHQNNLNLTHIAALLTE